MKISNFLKTDRIILDLKTKSKEETIRYLARLAENAPEIQNHEKFVSDIFERENLGTTGIGFHLALPHARTDAVSSFVIVVGYSKDGIDFSSLDGELVNLVFLMGTPKNEVQNYLGILAHLTRILKKENFRKSLFSAESPEQFIEYFSQEEQ